MVLKQSLHADKNKKQQLELDEKQVQEIRTIVETKNLKHVAIMPDGNRRWARARGLSPIDGHTVGFTQIAPSILQFLFEVGVPVVTLGCCSTENLSRDPDEVNNGMKVFSVLVQNFLPIAERLQIKIIHLGRKDRIPQFLLEVLEEAEQRTAYFTKCLFNIGIDYGGRDEVLRACKILLKKGLSIDDITEEIFAGCLDTRGQTWVNPDIVIRTSGEQRVSGFMPWQAAYSELYFVKPYFPDLNTDILAQIIIDFNGRNRRFGR